MNLDAFKEISKDYPELKAIFDGIAEITGKIEQARDDAERITLQANERYEDAKREHKASMESAEDQRERADAYDKELQTQFALIAAFSSILVKQKSDFRDELERIGNTCKDDATTGYIIELIDKLKPAPDEEETEEIPTLDDAV
jgi:vacuolar-type H+-ATPase subunit E/Vma4